MLRCADAQKRDITHFEGRHPEECDEEDKEDEEPSSTGFIDSGPDLAEASGETQSASAGLHGGQGKFVQTAVHGDMAYFHKGIEGYLGGEFVGL